MGGYFNSKNEFQDTEDVVLVPAAVFSAASTNGDAIDVGDRNTANLELVATASTGSDETCDITIQTSKDKSGSGLGAWRTVGTFTQLTAAGSERKAFAGLDRFVRAVVAIGGTGTFTLSVKGELK